MKSLFEALQLPDPDIPYSNEPDLLDLTGQEFCKGVVNSRQYRQSIINRILSQDLPSAIECRLLDHAWGKPPDRLEVNDTTVRLDELSAEELEERALKLASRARQLRMNSVSSGDDDGVVVN